MRISTLANATEGVIYGEYTAAHCRIISKSTHVRFPGGLPFGRGYWNWSRYHGAFNRYMFWSSN